jgi:hypothetical protein
MLLHEQRKEVYVCQQAEQRGILTRCTVYRSGSFIGDSSICSNLIKRWRPISHASVLPSESEARYLIFPLWPGNASSPFSQENWP